MSIVSDDRTIEELTERVRGRHEADEDVTLRRDSRVINGLGWFSIGLGLAELLVPDPLARLIGVRERPALFRLLGLRELASGIAIFSRQRPAGALWSRVGGDLMDLSLLGLALGDPRNDRDRINAAIAAVGGVTALDLLCATRTTQSAPRVRTIRVVRTIAINRPPADCYAFWRGLENLPRFMRHVVDVKKLDEGRSHWVVRAPAGRTVEWDAEIVRQEPDRLIAWRSLEGADVDSTGVVEFSPRPGGKGTILRVAMEYRPPAGVLGAVVAKVFGEAPEQQMKEDLRRLKRLLETGEIPTTEGQPAGPREPVHRSLAKFFTGGVS